MPHKEGNWGSLVLGRREKDCIEQFEIARKLALAITGGHILKAEHIRDDVCASTVSRPGSFRASCGRSLRTGL